MARNDGRTNDQLREISWVRPPNFTFTLSRSERVCVARGSIEYSEVTQPLPESFNQRGTPGENDATQRTRGKHDCY